MERNIKMENSAPRYMKKQELLELLDNLVNGIQKQHDTAKELTDEIEKQCKELNTELLKIQAHKKTANTLSDEISKQHENVKNLNSEVQKWHDDSKTSVSEIQEQQKKAGELIDAIQKQSEATNTCFSEIEEQKNTAKQLTVEIKEQHDTDTKIIAEKQKKYKELVKQIEDLLPGATSAKLAGSYHKARTEKKTKWYWIGFIGALIALMMTYIFILLKEITWMTIVTRTITGIPLVWIAWYCQKSISQTNRIKEEYHHKQRVMAVFDGFSKQIDELTKDNLEQNKEKKLELISVIINAIKKNPAEKIDTSGTLLDLGKNKKKNPDKNKTSEEATT